MMMLMMMMMIMITMIIFSTGFVIVILPRVMKTGLANTL